MLTLLIPGVGLVKGSGGLLIPGAGRVYLTVAPTITTADLGTLTVGTPVSLQLTATGDEPITWSATGLPAGLSLSSTGLLTGTPTTAGAYSATITATNAGGGDADVFAGTVGASSATNRIVIAFRPKERTIFVKKSGRRTISVR